MSLPVYAGRCSTGIEGLDDILRGGLPCKRLYLIQGDPGVGKTTLALQFLLTGAAQGDKGLYVTLSETREELDEVALSHGWDLSRLSLFELSSIEQELVQSAQNTIFHPSDIELNRTTKTILDEVTRIGPKRVVFDSLSELRLLAENPLRYRRQILALKQFFAGRDCTVLMLDDKCDAGVEDSQVLSISHGVISLQVNDSIYGVERRRLKISKLRGSKFRGGFHDYTIEKGGINVYPRLVAAEHQAPFQFEIVPSGIAELDSLLGGGINRGTSTLLVGPTGVGKSSIALQYAMTACKRGEPAIMFFFDENMSTVRQRAAAFGLPLDECLQSKIFDFQQIDPAEMPPGEFTHRIRKAVEKDKARCVVIDSLNGYLQAMPDEKALNLQLHELLTYLGQCGVATLMTVTQHGLIGNMQSPVDITYISDNVLLLRYFESGGSIKKAISAIKKRTGTHEDTIRELKIDSEGIRIGESLKNFHGVLTGSPHFLGESNEMLAERS